MSGRQHESSSRQDLVKRAQAGDREAFTALMGEYGYRLCSLVHLRLSDPLLRFEEQQDILQEVWKRAFESLERFKPRGEGSFFHWLGAIADHVVKDLKRRRRGPRGRQASLEQVEAKEGEIASPHTTTPSRALRREERFRRLVEALDKLKPDHREVIILSRVRGLPTEEIAALMNRSRGAVRVLLFRALKELKGHFGGTDSYHLPARSLEAPGVPPPPEPKDGRAP